ncbi:MAG: gamma-butyrobetaine hydroxylase-like domain-containing protein, partial [Gammaproteobacteria bacterium]
NYAVILHFDDGHNTGIYSWDELYKLSVNHDAFWANYLKECEKAGKPRKSEG